MRTVEDAEGRRYHLLKASTGSSRVRDLATGEERYLPNDELRPVDGTGPLEEAAARLDPDDRAVVSGVGGDRGLGLLIEVVEGSPLPVRTMLARYDLCESDLHGLLGELTAAGLVEPTEVAGERAYEPTPAGRAGLEALQSAGTG